MKTTPDGWPVYEDTGDRVDCHEDLHIVDERERSLETWSHAAIRLKPPQVSVSDGTRLSPIPDVARLFRHPHNAADAWLKAVSGEEEK